MAFGGNLSTPTTANVANNQPTMLELSQENNTTGLNDPIVNQNELNSDLDNPTTRIATSGAYYIYDEMLEAEKFTSIEGAPTKFGAPSLFNPYSLFLHPRLYNNNSVDFYYDKEGVDGAFPKKDRKLTIDGLLRDFDPEIQRSKPYYATDFVYCKYYKKIPLNRMITLRRFPFPTFDNLEFSSDTSQEYRPIAQAVTYFGEPTGNELNELTKFKGTINWKELTADVHEVEGNEQGFDSSPLATGNRGLNTALKGINAIGGGNSDLSGRRNAEMQSAKQFGDVDYTNKVLGPVNVVTKTHIRDRGIGAEKEYSIVFEYKLRSLEGVNPKIAMLDLLSNMLALTFNNAKFWGGANRYFPNQPQFGFFGDQKAFYEGRYGDYATSVFDTFKTGFGKIGDALGEIISGIASGDLSALKKYAMKLGGAALDLKSAKSRPAVLGFKALLSGLPVGEWHMQIGNPYNPIMSVGNLICTGFEFEFGNHLGVDDFPDELKFIVNLKDGRPRDKGDVESVFNMGEGRMYYPPTGVLDVGNLSASTSGASPSAKGKNKRPKLDNPIVAKKVQGSAW